MAYKMSFFSLSVLCAPAQSWSSFQKTYNKLITKQNLMKVFCGKVVCVPLILSQTQELQK